MAAARASRHEDRATSDERVPQGIQHRPRQTCALESHAVHAGKPQRYRRTPPRDGRQHDVSPDALPQSHIRARCRLIDVAPTLGDDPHGQLACLSWPQTHPVLPLGSRALIDPQRTVTRDEDIGRARIRHRAGQRAEKCCQACPERSLLGSTRELGLLGPTLRPSRGGGVLTRVAREEEVH